MRIDQLLVSQKLAPSRSAAQRLIERGAVELLGAQGWQRVLKTGSTAHEGAELRITDAAELRYVSRGGLKLEAALAHAALSVQDKLCLDIGQSTGGFTDVLLRAGALHVVGIDVGHSQLHTSLANHPKVTAFEGINARSFVCADLGVSEGFDVIVGDLSFISLTLALDAISKALKASGEVLHLVKPQFELDASKLGKGGIVKDAAHYALVRERVCAASESAGLQVQDYFPSAIEGGDGNREFFIHLKKA
jgi:23S rRNA (cytidine1920-2'-O)/16S rRNA (cytidine1409-2'-O)-methyltransferase